MRAVPKPDGVAKDAKRLARRRGKSAEERITTRLGGRKVPFSVAGVLEKGDVRSLGMRPELFVEVKYSGEMRAKDGAHTYSLAYETIEKTVLDARAAGCVPVVSLVFGGREHVLYCTTADVFEELVSQSRRLHERYVGGVRKDVTSFSRRSATKDGLASYCKDCSNIVSKQWRQDNPEQFKQRKQEWYSTHREHAKAIKDAWREANWSLAMGHNRKSVLKIKYGMTLEDFWLMWEMQLGCCAICHQPFSSTSDAHIDHDHSTGRVRDLLCAFCNKMLGLARDQPEVLISGAEYLQRHAAPPLQDAV